LQNYHLLLFDREAMEASVEIGASSDSQAAATGTVVFQSCADRCDRFEVRRNANRIAGMARVGMRRELLIDELTAETQQIAAEVERRLLDSKTKIAESRSLLARSADLIDRLNKKNLTDR
jgi:hypothetical protein